MGSQPFTPQDQPLLLAAGLTKTLEGSNAAASPVHSRLVLTGATIRPRPLVTWGVGLGAAARSSASGAAGQPALAAGSGPEAWHLGSRDPNLSASPATLAGLRPDPS
ncbi:hypothetical protein ABBQ38_010435 [Trebouxia sp. C0009 RCD-2024]